VAFSKDGARTFGAPIRVDEAGSLGRVDVELLPDGSAAVSWIELADKRAAFMVRRIDAAGRRSAATSIAQLGEGRGTVYPRMAGAANELVFTWTDTAAFRVQTAVARLP
jgi:hypothetical protein